MRFPPCFLLLAVALFSTSTLLADIIYVTAGRGGNGTAWNSAHDDLTDALDRAVSGDEIRISQGTYRTGYWPHTSTSRTATFRLKTGVTVRGGYAPGGSVSQPDLYPTILTGEIGAAGNADNSYHVVTATGTGGSASRLENVTITGGNANGSAALRQHIGGGYLSDGASSPYVTNVIITGNRAELVGGGAYLNESYTTFTGCTFSNNSTPVNGGGEAGEGAGVYHNQCNPVYTDCTFSGNAAADLGGAMSNHGSSPKITGCSFVNNSATNGGGAIYNTTSYNPGPAANKISGCSFIGNSGTDSGLIKGGAIYNLSASPAIENCIFENNIAVTGRFGIGGAVASVTSEPTFLHCSFEFNEAGESGGALYHDNSPVSVNNCSFYENSSQENGGAIYIKASSSNLVGVGHCSFESNEGGESGGAVHCQNSSVIFQSSTFAKNSANSGDTIFLSGGNYNLNNCSLWDDNQAPNDDTLRGGGDAIIRNCIIRRMSPNNGGTNFGNLDGTNPANEPLLAPMGDYGGLTKTMPPLPGSSTIDPPSVTNSSAAFDQRGAPRTVGGITDIGAVEIQGTDDHFNITFDLDRDKDGYTDGMEAAMGTDPLLQEFSNPKYLQMVSGQRVFRVNIARVDLLPRFSYSRDLKNWIFTRVQPAGLQSLSGGSDTILFVRLHITRPPYSPVP